VLHHFNLLQNDFLAQFGATVGKYPSKSLIQLAQQMDVFASSAQNATKLCIPSCPFSLHLLYVFSPSLLSSYIPETNIVSDMIKQFPP